MPTEPTWPRFEANYPMVHDLILPNALLWGSQGSHSNLKNDKITIFKQLSKSTRPWLSLQAAC
jgi:hypothetical protein